jgi:hypothetical protein
MRATGRAARRCRDCRITSLVGAERAYGCERRRAGRGRCQPMTAVGGRMRPRDGRAMASTGTVEALSATRPLQGGSRPSSIGWAAAARSGHYAPVGLALVGVAMLAFEVALARWLPTRLKERGRPSREAWLVLPRLVTSWVAVALVASAVSPAAAVAFSGLVAAVYLIVVLARARGLPEFARQLRRMGEPDAWRGTERR